MTSASPWSRSPASIRSAPRRPGWRTSARPRAGVTDHKAGSIRSCTRAPTATTASSGSPRSPGAAAPSAWRALVRRLHTVARGHRTAAASQSDFSRRDRLPVLRELDLPGGRVSPGIQSVLGVAHHEPARGEQRRHAIANTFRCPRFRSCAKRGGIVLFRLAGTSPPTTPTGSASPSTGTIHRSRCRPTTSARGTTCFSPGRSRTSRGCARKAAPRRPVRGNGCWWDHGRTGALTARFPITAFRSSRRPTPWTSPGSRCGSSLGI